MVAVEGPQTSRNVDEQVHDYLLQLDDLRQQCERAGDFVRAQQCVNRMRDVNLRHAKRIESMSRQANTNAKTRLADEHRMELITFSRMWEDKLADYDDHARMVLDEVKMKHADDYRQQEGILKVQLMNRRPRFSKSIIDLRSAMERAVQQRKYLEAEEIKKKLVVMEQYEIDTFDSALAQTFTKKTQTLKQQYVNEMSAVEQKVKMGRDELLAQRKIDFEKLLRRHANAIQELDQQTKVHVAKTRQYVHRQIKALVQDPVKTGLELRGVAKEVREKRARLMRSKTPPARNASERAPRGVPQYEASLSLEPSNESQRIMESRYGW